MHLNELVKDIVQDSNDIPKIKINNICTHSGLAKNGSLFVAMYGKKFDGHDFIKKAVENGASAINLLFNPADVSNKRSLSM